MVWFLFLMFATWRQKDDVQQWVVVPMHFALRIKGFAMLLPCMGAA